MRLVTKAEFIERRSMQYFAHHHDFERMFYEDFMDIDWMDKQCAEENMLGQIKKFLARKLAAGMTDIHMEDLEEFHKKIKQQLEDKAQEWEEEAGRQQGSRRKIEKARKNAEFFRNMASSLRQKINDMQVGEVNRFIWQV